jgi:hypothetical protein
MSYYVVGSLDGALPEAIVTMSAIPEQREARIEHAFTTGQRKDEIVS